MVRKIVNPSGSMASKINDRDRCELTDEERFGMCKGIDAARDGNFAPDDEMETFYRCHRDCGSDSASGMEAERPNP